MILFFLLILSLSLYFLNKKVSSIVLFFALITNGFQLIPATLIDGKGTDFALIYIFVVLLYEISKKGKRVFEASLLIKKAILFFLIFLCVIVIINILLYNVPFNEVLRTGRGYLFLFSIFLFGVFSANQINKVLLILFKITLFCSVIYIFQTILNEQLLSGYVSDLQIMNIAGFSFRRFYNYPSLLIFFFFFSIFANPYQGWKKKTSMIILVITIILPMHRSMLIMALCCLILGKILQSGKFAGALKYIIIGMACAFIMGNILSARFNRDDIGSDISAVRSGSYKPTFYSNNEGNFTFRVAHFYERFTYVVQNPAYALWGVGFMTEDSPLTQQFNFHVGLYSEEYDRITQLDTGDIAWSPLILRLGIAGTIIFLIFFIRIFMFSFKHRKIPISLVLFLTFFLMLTTSFTSSGFADMAGYVLPLLAIQYIHKRLIIDKISDKGNSN